MKPYHKLFFILALLFVGLNAFSQSSDIPKALVKQGVALNDSGKYDQAIAKYDEAIKADPNYQDAWYEKSYTLFISGREKEALPFLEKVIQLNPSSAQAYDMLGSIYDDMKDPDKALSYYQLGVKADSTYQRLHFNMAITYYRIGKFAESETSALKAVKLDPKHASSQRIFAMAAYKQKERGTSLLAWCSFLLLEPQTKRSPEALNYVKNILGYGIKWTGEKSVTLTVNSDEGTANMLMPMTVTTALDKKSNLSAVDSIRYQLAALFEIANAITGDKSPAAVKHYYADYFEKLFKSANMSAFTHFITLSAYKDENVSWFKEHDKELSDFDQWIAKTERKF